jgi:hypothetical protein
MPKLTDISEEASKINAALQEWRQGDFALEEKWFVHSVDPSLPLTLESSQVEGEIQSITSEVEGLVIVTQSCDVVRSCIKRPFIEVSPLVKVTTDNLLEIKKMKWPAYAFIPAAEKLNLVAHIDRTMTVEKSVVSGWKRTQGCQTDAEVRNFAQALARKCARFAFPDDFHELVDKLIKCIGEKPSKQSKEGLALKSLREIRVNASPSWKDTPVEILFYFIHDENETNFNGLPWYDLREIWLGLIKPQGRYKSVDGIVTTLEDITAQEYTQSEQLDLDHISR